MFKGSIIIRLIDVVLLLLFGFMVISEINRKSPVKLPQSQIPIKSKIDEEELLIVGFIKTNDRVRIIIEGKKNLSVPNLQSLENFISEEKESFDKFNRRLRVRIRSTWNLPIKYTMHVANFCHRQGIAVGLDVQSVSRETGRFD